MKGVSKIILIVLLSLVCITLIITGYLYWQDNPITKANQLKARAKKAMYAAEYLQAFNIYQELFDTLGVKEEASSMNYANSALMSSNILKGGFYGSSGKIKLPDSTLSLLADISEMEYSQLSGSTDDKIASLAFNQRGFSMLKADNLLQQPNADSTLTAALEHFKNALRRNPDNDSARYNYELVARLAAYPQTVMRNVQSLVEEHRYRQAAELLEGAMRRNPALEKQKEYLERLTQIVKIDSIYGRSR
jgi:Ca-activated chloride channel homolog